MPGPASPSRHLYAVVVGLVLLVVALSGVCIALAVSATPQCSGSGSTTTSSRPVGLPSIVLVGDSNTEYGSKVDLMGYQAMLSGAYIRKADVVNRGHAGWTTRGWAKALPTLFGEFQGKRSTLLVVVLIGTNDACIKEVPACASITVPLDEFKTNVETIVSSIKKALQSHVLLVTPPPLDNTTQFGTIRSMTNTRQYADAMAAVGAKLNVPVLDLWPTLQTNVSSYFYDGLHLNRKGHLAVYDLLTSKIRDAFPTIAASSLPVVY